MLNWSRFLKGTFWIGGSRLSGNVINLIIIAKIISIFGLENYGILVAFQLFSINSGFLIIFTIGIKEFILKYSAQNFTANDYASISELYSFVFILGLIISVFVSTSLFYFFDTISDIITLEEKWQYLLKIYFCMIPVQFATLIYRSFVEGFQEYRLSGISEIIALSFYGILVFFLFDKSSDFSEFLQIFIIYQLLQFLVLIFLTYKFSFRLKFSFNNLSKQYINYKKFFLTLLSTSISSNLYAHAPKMILLKFLNVEALAVYDIASKIPRLIKTLLGAINSISIPFSSFVYKGGDGNTEINELFNTTFRFNLMVSCSVIFPLLIFGGAVLKIWVPTSEDIYGLELVLNILLVNALLSIFVNFGGPILIGINQNFRLIVFVSWSVSILSVLAMIFLVQKFETLGVAFGQLFGLIIAPYVITRYHFIFNLKWSEFYQFVLSGLLGSLVLFSCLKYWSGNVELKYFMELVCLVLSILLFLFLNFFLLSTKTEREMIIQLVLKRVLKFKI